MSYSANLPIDKQRFISMMVAVFASFLLVMSGQNFEEFPDTPLFAGIMEKDYDAGQLLIRQRIAKRYKVGSTEVGFESYLRSQGLFTKRSTTSNAPGAPVYGESEFVKSGLCNKVVRVNWRASRDRILRDIVVVYSSMGCL